MSNPLRRLARNSAATLMIRGGDMVYAFLSMAILARYFGPSLYGVYVFIISFVFIFIPIINFGIAPVMVRELTVRKAAGGDYFGSGVAFRVMTAILAWVIILAVLPFLGLNRIQRLALLIFCFSEFSWLAFAIFGEVYVAFERMEIGAYLSCGNRVLSLIILVAISHFDLGFLAVFFSLAILNVATLVVTITLVHRKFLRPRLVWRPDLLRFWFKASWAMAIASIIMQCFLRVDIYILRIFRSAAEIAYFEAPYKIVSHSYFISIALAIALSPTLARLAQTDLARFRPVMEQFLKLLFVVALPLTAAAIFLGPKIIVPLLGAKFAPAEPAMALLSWCIFLGFFEPILTAVLVFINKTKMVFLIHVTGLAVDILLDLLLIPHYGYLGACYSNIAAYGTIFLVSFAATYYFAGGFSLVQVTGRIAPAALVLAAGLYAYGYLAARMTISHNLEIILGILVALVLYPLILFLSRAITRQELAMLKESMDQP